MVKSDKEIESVPYKQLSQAQMKLIGELYEETNYSKQYCVEELGRLDRDVANKHIQFLKDLKSREYQDRKNHESGPVFDKIGFGMCFKIACKNSLNKRAVIKPSMDQFADECIDLYKIFKHAQERCREFVKDGGLK